MTKEQIAAGLERLSRQFMIPRIEGPIAVISYEDRYAGTCYVPADYEADVPVDYRDTIERYEGKYLAYLSAPGYMDRTDSTMHDTYDEAAAYLVKTYDDTGED